MHHLLISTHTNLILARLSETLKEASFSVVSSGHRFYGIACDGEEIWVAINTRETEAPSRIEGFFKRHTLDIETPLADVHQITYANGGLYICNTFYNAITYVSLARPGVEHSFTLGGTFEHDYAHPNSIWVDGERVWVMCHNKRSRFSELARLRHDPRWGFDLGMKAEIRWRLPHQACHNFRFDRGLLTYLASEDARIIQRDVIGDFPGRGIPTPEGYLKGLTRVQDSFVFGLNPLVAAEERYESQASLGVASLLDEGFLHGLHVLLPDGSPSGNINEIRQVPAEMFA